MKKLKILGLLLVLALSFTACSDGGSTGDAVAKVNGETISKEEYQKEYDFYRKMLYGQMEDADLDKDGGNGKSIKENLRDQVVDALVMDKIVDDEMKAQKLELTDKEVDQALNDLIEQSGGEEAFNAQMETMGIEKDDMKSMVSQSLKLDKLKGKYVEENKRPQEEVEKYFEENKESLISYDVSHILVENEDEAMEIKKQLDDGKDFAELAKEKSQDPGSAEKGGDLGTITMQTNFVQEFLDALAGMEKGEISDPVKSDFGYHIIYLRDVKDKLEDHEDTIQNALLAPEVDKYIRNLYEGSDIEIYKEASETEDPSTVTEETEETEETEGEAPEVEETENNETDPKEDQETDQEEGQAE